MTRARDGYVAAMCEADLQPRLYNHVPPPISMLQSRATFGECVSDPCAFGVMTEAQAQGVAARVEPRGSTARR